MGKAFTEEERIKIKEQIMKVGFELFAKQGVEKVKIREITNEVGIAQGGFYTFFKDKQDLVFGIMDRAHENRTKYVLSLLPGTETDPKAFIREIVMHTSMHMYDSKIYWKEKQDILYLLTRMSEQENSVTRRRDEESIKVMQTYWRKHGQEVTIDSEKLFALLHMVCCLSVNKKFIGEMYFDEMFMSLVNHLLDQCVQVRKLRD